MDYAYEFQKPYIGYVREFAAAFCAYNLFSGGPFCFTAPVIAKNTLKCVKALRMRIFEHCYIYDNVL